MQVDTIDDRSLSVVRTAVIDLGFECVGECSPEELEVNEYVRHTCAGGGCRSFGKNWTCPPACGNIDDFEQSFSNYSLCIVFQTVGTYGEQLRYSWVLKLLERHTARNLELVEQLKDRFPKILYLFAEPCEACKPCTYPKQPCPHPELVHPSMEAAGLMVSDVCKSAGVPFHHGKGTFSFISCLLV